MITVKVVCEGYLRRENGLLVEAHSTSTLIMGGRSLILVDTSSPALRPRLLDGLIALGVDPEEVDVVINTHLHHDHTGNNGLFPRAARLARVEEGPGPEYERVIEDRELQPGIRLFHTPGHTRGSMSVAVEADDARYVIAGDALPTRDNYERWVPPGVNYDAQLALLSMRRIIDQAEVVVPGHGPPFAVARFSRPA